MPKGDVKATKEQVARAMAVTNCNYSKAAKLLNISRQSVYSRVKNDDELAEMVKKERYKFFESLPIARVAIEELIADWANKDVRKKMDETERKQGHTSAMEMLKSAGMIPSTGQTTYIQNVMNNYAVGTGVSPVLNALFEKHFEGLKMPAPTEEEQAIEAEYQEVTD